jgi:hypothetical protein
MLTLCFLTEIAEDRKHIKVYETLNGTSEGSVYKAQIQETSWLLATNLAWLPIMLNNAFRLFSKGIYIRVTAVHIIGQTAEQGYLDNTKF